MYNIYTTRARVWCSSDVSMGEVLKSVLIVRPIGAIYRRMLHFVLKTLIVVRLVLRYYILILDKRQAETKTLTVKIQDGGMVVQNLDLHLYSINLFSASKI